MRPRLVLRTALASAVLLSLTAVYTTPALRWRNPEGYLERQVNRFAAL